MPRTAVERPHPQGARGKPVSGRRRFIPTHTESIQCRRVLGPRYLFVHGEADREAHVVPLREGLSRVGTRADNHLQILHPTVSGHHCELRNRRGQVEVRDVGSKNGVRIQGTRVSSAEIGVGQAVRLGHVTLLLLDAVPEASEEGVELLPGVIGTSPAMRRMVERVQRLAGSGLSVLITGETGTGKDLVARALHDIGRRSTGPFVALNCAALPEHLIESELFGHERGAFTGASGHREGLFEVADGGTLFLDEVGELPLSQQPKLLRALEQREIRRVGSTRTIEVDVRVVAATLAPLPERVAQGRFREDLFFRLSEATLEVPPLSSRLEDIPLLVAHFLSEAAPRSPGRGTSRRGRPLLPGEPEGDRGWAIGQLCRRAYPGNVRELRSLVRLAGVLGWEEALTPRLSSAAAAALPSQGSGGSETRVAPPLSGQRETCTGILSCSRAGSPGADAPPSPVVSFAPIVDRACTGEEPAPPSGSGLRDPRAPSGPEPLSQPIAGASGDAPGDASGDASSDDAPAGFDVTDRASEPLATYRRRGLPDLERKMILDALEKARGNRSKAARLLGLPKSTYADRLRRIEALPQEEAD